MARKSGRPGGYLKQRGSTWYVRFQYPAPVRASVYQLTGTDPGPEFVLSLQTTDQIVAEDRAAVHVRRHKRFMLLHAAATDETTKWGDIQVNFEQAPGTSLNHDDGSFSLATEKEITTRFKDGSVTTRPNQRHVAIEFTPEAKRTPVYQEWAGERDKARKALTKDTDSEIIENYITRNRKNEEDAGSVRRTLAEFKAFVEGRVLAQCKRADAEGFITWLATKGGKKGTGIASGTIKRNVALLKAAINVELKQTDEPRLTRNIFELAEIEGGDEKHRDAFTEADMATVRAHAHEFETDELLMWTWHAASSIRPIEIHGIDHDAIEEARDPNDLDPTTGQPRVHRTRYVGLEAGEKAYAKRALPIPQAVLDLRKPDGTPVLPDKIEGPLFTRTVDRLNDAINSKLEKWGVKTPENGKSFYSCRHRAPLRFIAEGVKDEQATRAIMGHNRSVEPHHKYGRRRGYGHRFSMWELKPIIDKIGC